MLCKLHVPVLNTDQAWNKHKMVVFMSRTQGWWVMPWGITHVLLLLNAGILKYSMEDHLVH